MNWERSKKCSNEAIRKAQNVSKQEIKKNPVVMFGCET